MIFVDFFCAFDTYMSEGPPLWLLLRFLPLFPYYTVLRGSFSSLEMTVWSQRVLNYMWIKSNGVDSEVLSLCVELCLWVLSGDQSHAVNKRLVGDTKFRCECECERSIVSMCQPRDDLAICPGCAHTQCQLGLAPVSVTLVRINSPGKLDRWLIPTLA